MSRPDAAAAGWTAAGRLALLGYPIVIVTIGFTIPGPQYDEALLVNGGLQMLLSSGPPTLVHGEGMWVPAFGRWWPLMTMPYVGAAKSYLVAPAFALFGVETTVVRVVSALLAVVGIWGVSRLIRRQVGSAAGAAVAAILALQPALVAHTVFDNGGVATWMAGLGLLCLALDRHLRLAGAGSAFLLGLAAGFAVWARLNFLWLLAGLCLAAAVELRRGLVPPRRQLVAMLLGGVLAVLPILAYLRVSRLATLRFARAAAVAEPLADRAAWRLGTFLEALVCDAEQRAVWSGAAPPAWQWRLLSAALLVAVVASVVPSRGARSGRAERWTRGAAWAFLLYLALMLGSRLPVKGHHLVTALPLAAVVAVLGLSRLVRIVPAARPAVAVLFALYVGFVGQWALAAGRSMRASGGGGTWSSASAELERLLTRRAGERVVALLDWGLGDKLFFLSGGRLRTDELFWEATVETTSRGESWRERVARGGVFVAWPSAPTRPPPAVAGFERALVDSRAAFSRTVVLRPDGLPFAVVFEVSAAAEAVDAVPPPALRSLR